MLPEIPELIPWMKYVLSGRFLNRVCERVIKQTPLAGHGVDLAETANGLIPTASAGAPAAESDICYSFQCTLNSPTEVHVRGGYASGTDWTGWSQDDPKPQDWLTEISVADADLTIADGDSVWLEVVTPVTNATINGPLPLTDATAHTVDSGGGGGGGQGGGGGGGGDSAGDGTTGGAGTDAVGTVGGVGGDAGANGGGSPGEGDGTGGKGSDGGDGGEGGAGEVVTFPHYTLLRVRTRRYGHFSASLTVSAGKPSGSHTTLYVRLASLSGGVITQHHAGNLTLTLPIISFVP